MDPVESVLKHFGVRGMKWGVRKSRSSSGSKSQVAHPKSAEAAQVHDILGNIHKHGIGAATNSDLKMLEQRIKLETKFNEMFPKKKHPAVMLGEELVKRILIPVGEQQAKAFLNKKGSQLIGPGTPVKQNPSQSSSSSAETITSILNTKGSHHITDKPRIGFV